MGCFYSEGLNTRPMAAEWLQQGWIKVDVEDLCVHKHATYAFWCTHKFRQGLRDKLKERMSLGWTTYLISLSLIRVSSRSSMNFSPSSSRWEDSRLRCSRKTLGRSGSQGCLQKHTSQHKSIYIICESSFLTEPGLWTAVQFAFSLRNRSCNKRSSSGSLDQYH